MADRSKPPLKPVRALKYRPLIVAILFILFVASLMGALTIPFFFESSTMFYKFGWKKTLLRFGKMVGLTATAFLLLQLPMAARLKWLDRVFSLPSLYTLHRYNAYLILFLVAVHPIAVFVPDGILMIPFELRYWPEWVGAGLLMVILLQFATSYWRRTIFKAYEKWLLLHRFLGLTALAMLMVHILYVSDTFENDGLPRTLVLALAAGVLALWCWVRIKGLTIRKKRMQVTNIAPAGEDAHAITIDPMGQGVLNYAPGQFSFISFESEKISKEPHPFTLSSSPSGGHPVEITIRSCGDWTRRIHTLKPGEKVYFQGPFGRFSHLLVAPHNDIIMIAGGIGITPMLSMLRYINDSNDTRRTLLIWSNQTPRHLFNTDELNAMENKLSGFRWIPVFTREMGDQGHFGRLDRQLLASLLQSYERDAAAFVCGPPAMTKQVRTDLRKLGFRNRSIHFEAFDF